MNRNVSTHPALTGTPLQKGILVCLGLGPLWRGVARSAGVCQVDQKDSAP